MRNSKMRKDRLASHSTWPHSINLSVATTFSVLSVLSSSTGLWPWEALTFDHACLFSRWFQHPEGEKPRWELRSQSDSVRVELQDRVQRRTLCERTQWQGGLWRHSIRSSATGHPGKLHSLCWQRHCLWSSSPVWSFLFLLLSPP